MRRDPRTFATAAFPLRASSIPDLVLCPMKRFLLFQGELHDSGNTSAEVGTMVHSIVASWHRSGFDEDGAIAFETEWEVRYPLVCSAGKYKHVLEHVSGYCGDPRNKVRPVLLEHPVSVELPAHETDPTGQSVVVQGTLDQVRETTEGLRLYDLKTGRTEGAQMLNLYAYQVAAYCIMATELLGEPVNPGALIRSSGYLGRNLFVEPEPPGVFFHLPWNLDDCRDLLDSVRLAVANIRRGEVTFVPGYHCATTCPARGLQRCLSMWKKTQK